MIDCRVFIRILAAISTWAHIKVVFLRTQSAPRGGGRRSTWQTSVNVIHGYPARMFQSQSITMPALFSPFFIKKKYFLISNSIELGLN